MLMILKYPSTLQYATKHMGGGLEIGHATRACDRIWDAPVFDILPFLDPTPIQFMGDSKRRTIRIRRLVGDSVCFIPGDADVPFFERSPK